MNDDTQTANTEPEHETTLTRRTMLTIPTVFGGWAALAAGTGGFRFGLTDIGTQSRPFGYGGRPVPTAETGASASGPPPISTTPDPTDTDSGPVSSTADGTGPDSPTSETQSNGGAESQRYGEYGFGGAVS